MSRISARSRGWVACSLAAVLFGGATPFTKLVVDDAGPVVLAGLLYLGAALAVAPFTLGEPRRGEPTGQRTKLLGAVVLGGGLAPVLLLLALDRTPSTTVSLLLNLEVVATVIIAGVFLREHLGRGALAGSALVVLSGLLLAGTNGAVFAPGAVLVAGACVCWGIDNALTASIDAYSPARVTLVKGAVAGTVNLTIGLVVDGLPPLTTVLAGMTVGAVGYGISITMWISGARLLGAARGQVVFATAPFVGALLAWPVLGDHISGTVLAAFTIALVGVAVMAVSHHGHQHRHEPMTHAHAIDPDDPHHHEQHIEVVRGDLHRHLPFAHEHEHLPDIHHRHDHDHAR